MRCLAAVGACAAVAAPQASAGWLAPLPLSAPDQHAGPGAVALGADGRMVVAWTRSDGSKARVEAAERAPGGALEAPQRVSAGGADAFSPQVGLDAQGNALLMWRRGTEFGWATRPAGASVFGDLDVVPLPFGESAGDFRLAVAPNGAAVALVSTFGAGGDRLRIFVRPPGGVFSAVGGVFASGSSGPDDSSSFGSLDVDADAHGGFYASWSTAFTHTPPGGYTNTAVVVARRAAGEPAFTVQTVASGQDDTATPATDTRVTSAGSAVDADGNISVLYRLQNRSLFPRQTSLLLASAASNSSFPAPGGPETIVSPTTNEPASADIDMNPAGAALLAWTLGDASPAAEACFRPAGGPCGAVKTLQTGEAYFAVAAIGAGGEAVAAWSQGLSPGVARASFRPAGGDFGEAAELNTGLNVLIPHHAADVDPLGHAVVVSNSLTNDPPGTTTAFVNDSVPPAIPSFAAPAGGAPGVPLTFGGGVFDVWGPVSAMWDFGDGSTAPGPGATHSYAAPGAFTAALTATDAGGNSTTRSAPVDIAAPVDVTAPDETPPRILSFGMTHTAFAVGRGRTPLSAGRVPVGTTFRFRGSEAGSAAITIQRKHGRRWKKVGTLRRRARAGANSVAFTGRLGKKALRAGGYRAVLTETDAAKNKSKARRLGFRVVRR